MPEMHQDQPQTTGTLFPLPAPTAAPEQRAKPDAAAPRRRKRSRATPGQMVLNLDMKNDNI